MRRILRWSAAVVILAVAALVVAYATSGNPCDEDASPAGDRMKAIVFCDYGAVDVLKLQEVAKPVPGDDELLVRVRAAALNPLDLHRMTGTPLVMRIEMGLRRPELPRLGVDYAGVVEAVGKNVTQFKPGDEVFGGRTGSIAQFIRARADRAVVLKPANVTFEQAAAVAVSAVTALQGLRDEGKLGAGQKVLINGASGGVGTFAVQIAKALGAEVTGVCSTRNVELVRSLGADRVIDYTREDFTSAGERYDVILDNVGNHSLSECRRVLEPNGRYVMVGGRKGRWIAPMPRAAAAHIMSWFVSQDMGFFIAELNKEDLTTLRDLMQAGKVTPVIDRRYPLSEVAEAMRYLQQGRARGKVVITLD